MSSGSKALSLQASLLHKLPHKFLHKLLHSSSPRTVKRLSNDSPMSMCNTLANGCELRVALLRLTQPFPAILQVRLLRLEGLHHRI